MTIRKNKIAASLAEQNWNNGSPLKIAVASGKGGTGKTTVSVNLFHFSNRHWLNTILVDCDVEEPNDALFFNEKKAVLQKDTFQLVPEIDPSKCTFCRKCAEWCEFNAITIVSKLKFTEINSDLCHSCGACSYACKFDAIKEYKQPLGSIISYDSGFGEPILEGRLKIGSSMQTMLIQRLKDEVPPGPEMVIYDAPPGTSCPLVETVADTDYVILVTEPTPFGLHDLKITVSLMRQLKKPFGVLVNKAGIGNQKVYQFLKQNNIELLGEIPFSKNYSGSYAQGRLFENMTSDIEQVYMQLIKKLKLKFNWQEKLPYSAEKVVPEKQ